jgi:hypothetical protein
MEIQLRPVSSQAPSSAQVKVSNNAPMTYTPVALEYRSIVMTLILWTIFNPLLDWCTFVYSIWINPPDVSVSRDPVIMYVFAIHTLFLVISVVCLWGCFFNRTTLALTVWAQAFIGLSIIMFLFYLIYPDKRIRLEKIEDETGQEMATFTDFFQITVPSGILFFIIINVICSLRSYFGLPSYFGMPCFKVPDAITRLFTQKRTFHMIFAFQVLICISMSTLCVALWYHPLLSKASWKSKGLFIFQILATLITVILWVLFFGSLFSIGLYENNEAAFICQMGFFVISFCFFVS